MRKRIPTLVVFLTVLAVPATAMAYFAATGSGAATAAVTYLSVPGSPAAASGSNVTVTWTASTINGSVAATSYTVERYSGSGSDLGAASCDPVASSSGNPDAFGSFSCTDSPSAGTYEYKVTANYGNSWTTTTGFTNTATVKNITSTTAAGPASATTGSAVAASSIGSALSGATSGATGTITFTVFGPQATAPTACTSGGATVGTATISGNGTYHPSTGYTPTTAGTYWWYASYSGDTNNAASTSTCGTGMASTVVWSETSAASVTDTTKNGTSSSTSSFVVQPSTTYLLFVCRHSASGDSLTSISSTGLSPSLSTSSFTSITSQSFNSSVDYQWAYYVTTASNASGTGTLTVSFTTPLPSSGVTIVDLVRLGGNNTSSPIVTTNEKLTTATSTSPTANLPNAPGSQDAEAVFLIGNANLGASAPTAPGLTSVFYSAQNAGSTALYSGTPAQQNSSLSAITSQAWGTIALELNHG